MIRVIDNTNMEVEIKRDHEDSKTTNEVNKRSSVENQHILVFHNVSIQEI